MVGPVRLPDPGFRWLLAATGSCCPWSCDDSASAPLIRCPAPDPKVPPLSVVCRLWRSVIPVVGQALCPIDCRTILPGSWLVSPRNPLLRQSQKQRRAVETGGKSSGSLRRCHPGRCLWRAASEPSHWSVVWRRPACFGKGGHGAVTPCQITCNPSAGAPIPRRGAFQPSHCRPGSGLQPDRVTNS